AARVSYRLVSIPRLCMTEPMMPALFSMMRGKSPSANRSQKKRSWRRAAEWKVRACTAGTPSPRSRERISRRLRCVGQGQNLVGRELLGGDSVGDAVRHGSGLARSGTGQDDHRGVEVGGDLSLLLVQGLEKGRGRSVHALSNQLWRSWPAMETVE